MGMTIKEAYEKLLGRPIPEPADTNPNVSLVCWCHDDKHESCSLNVETGGWFCHTTGNKGWLPHAMVATGQCKSVKEANALIALDDVQEAPAARRESAEKEPIPEAVKETYIRALNQEQDARDYAHRKLGWNPETLKRFGVGWATHQRRYTVPVYDDDGLLRNFRMYDPKSKGVDKMTSWKQGYGSPARLYPIDLLEDATDVVLCEGEKDTILMNQCLGQFAPAGWAAVTGTGGAGTWRDPWSGCFAGKNVYIVYDRDDAGARAALQVASKLVNDALSVKVVALDISEPRDADVTNYLVDSGKGWDDFRALVERTELFTPKTAVGRAAKPVDERVYEPHLSNASEGSYAYKKLRMKVMVAGKDLSPFLLPHRVAFACQPGSMNAMCNACALNSRNGLIEHTFEKDDPLLIEMLRIKKGDLSRFVRSRLGIVAKCPVVEEYVDDHQNVEEVTVVPALEFSDTDKEYVSRTAYVTGHGIQPNKEYLVDGTAVPHPRTQHVVHFLPTHEPAASSIDDFQMDDKKLDALAIFRPRDGQGVEEKMREIARDLVLNVTRIYGRDDLVTAVDLCYHTVLSFHFQDKKVEKSWGDILLVGDTRTGKTETVQALIWHYKAGEMSMGENTSFAGLVGGLKQDAMKRWSITWGRIPLNDRRLLVVDEMSGLSQEVLGAMSGIRSNGIAEMVKIETQRTAARTRLVWISNPRESKAMSQYTHGVEAVRALVGRPEDIARFDFVVSAATNEVPIERINAFQHETTEHVYTSDLCRELVLWAWSRKAEHVVMGDDTVRRVLDLAVEQSKRYASGGPIPLVEGGNHRHKLAKLAIATACRLFSTDDGERVLVTPEHVQFAADFLDRIYEKSSLDYRGWSETRLTVTQVSKESLDEADAWVRKHPDWSDLWLQKDELRLDDFKTQFDLDTKEARSDIFQPLTRIRMVEKSAKGSVYVKSPAFIQLLKDVLGELNNGGGATSATPDTDDDDPDADIPF